MNQSQHDFTLARNLRSSPTPPTSTLTYLNIPSSINMAMRRQPISPPPPASSERGRPYPARPASDSSMFRPPVQRCSWVTAPRSHDGKGIQPDDEYHRRLKASSKRDRQKLAREVRQIPAFVPFPIYHTLNNPKTKGPGMGFWEPPKR